jgi:exopolysaccharide biosynthesis polyprenyl glycosylphosphotransferase
VASIAFDVVTLLAANVLAAAFGTHSLSTWTVLLFDALVIMLLTGWHAYKPRMRLDVLDDVRLVAASTALAAMVVITLDRFAMTRTSGNGVGTLWLFSVALLSAGRVTSTQIALHRRVTRAARARSVIVGAGHVGRLTARRFLEHPEFGLDPIGFLDPEPIDVPGAPLPLPLLGDGSNIEAVLRQHDVDCVVVTFSNAPHEVFLDLVDDCEELGVRTFVVPRLFERVPARLSVEHVGGLPLLEMHPTSRHSAQYSTKYVLDRIVAGVLIVVLSPVLLTIALAVRISLGRPILYGQERVGLDGHRFQMLKFRSMLPPLQPAEDVQEFVPDRAPGGIEGADRRTRLGSVLRATSLDELLQLVNVLKGEMSLVGPRPERPEYVEYFASHVHRYDARHRVKGGITGWAQIHRLRGKTSITDRVEWDNYYIENFSLWLDLKILVLTIPAILRVHSE